MMTFLKLTGLLFALMQCQVVTAAILQIDGAGKLTGATGVNVDGVYYDVEFRSNVTFYDVFGSAAGLDATTMAQATLFSAALLDQVFIGTYDDNPGLTAGCARPDLCLAITPYKLQSIYGLETSAAMNIDKSGIDITTGEVFSPSPLLQTQLPAVYADWWPGFAPVPLPAALPLFSVGLLCLGFFRKVRSRAGTM